MIRSDIYPGIDYAFRIVDHAPLVRAHVEKSDPSGITGRLYNDSLDRADSPVVDLPSASFVTTWAAHRLNGDRRDVALRGDGMFVAGFAIGASCAMVVAAIVVLLMNLT